MRIVLIGKLGSELLNLNDVWFFFIDVFIVFLVDIFFIIGFF